MKKLKLNKEIVSELNVVEMNSIKGGDTNSRGGKIKLKFVLKF